MLNAFEITQDTEEGKLWSILGACDFDYLAVYSRGSPTKKKILAKA